MVTNLVGHLPFWKADFYTMAVLILWTKNDFGIFIKVSVANFPLVAVVYQILSPTSSLPLLLPKAVQFGEARVDIAALQKELVCLHARVSDRANDHDDELHLT